MQGLLPTILAILVYLSSLLGLTSSAVSPAISPDGGQDAPAYHGATEVMAYYAESRAGDPAPYQSLVKAAPSLTAVIPFSYHLDARGSLAGSVDRRVMSLARAEGLKVLALVHNAAGGRFDGETIHALLANRLARQRAIDKIHAVLVQNGLDGVNLDLENVPAADRQNLTFFLRDLAIKLRPRHFLVTASLPAKSADDLHSSWSGAYDYRALAPYLDQVMVMAYDEHIAGGTPGPVASLHWVEGVLQYAMTAFPRQKIVLGLPAYGYLWTRRGDRAIDFPRASLLLARKGIKPSWDYSAQAPYFRYFQDGCEDQVWFENSRSAAAKAALVRRYGLRGVAVWRLGYEDPALWRTLAWQLA